MCRMLLPKYGKSRGSSLFLCRDYCEVRGLLASEQSQSQSCAFSGAPSTTACMNTTIIFDVDRDSHIRLASYKINGFISRCHCCKLSIVSNLHGVVPVWTHHMNSIEAERKLRSSQSNPGFLIAGFCIDICKPNIVSYIRTYVLKMLTGNQKSQVRFPGLTL